MKKCMILTVIISVFIFSCTNKEVKNENREIASEQLDLFPQKVKEYDRSKELRLDKTTATGEAGSMMYVPVRDQGHYGTCFAEAASQMIDAFRFTVNKDNRHAIRTSATALGISGQTLYKPAQQLYNGETFDMVDYAKIHGIKSEFSMIKCAISKTNKNEVNAIVKLHTSYKDKLNAKANEAKASGFTSPEISDSYNKFKEKLDRSYSEKILEYLGKTGRNVNEIPPIVTISKLLDHDPFYLYWAIMHYSCLGEVPNLKIENLPKTIRSNVLRMSYNEFMKYLNEHLKSEKSLPVQIGYCAGVLIDGFASQGTSKDGKSVCLAMKNGGENGEHDSLIIGIRKNSKNSGFDLLIRNSWGKDCKYVNPKLTLPKEIREKYQSEWFSQTDKYYTGWNRYSSDWECDNGNIWVDSKVLYKSTYQLLSFRK